MRNTAKAYIHLPALTENLAKIKSLAPKSKIMAVIKANAYGHGLLRTASALSAADGLAVARLDEALRLKQAGINQRLLLLGTLLSVEELTTCAEQNIDIVVHSRELLEQISAYRGKKLNVWAKLDTGMHRLGFSEEEYAGALHLLQDSKAVDEIVLMSHFSGSEYTAGADTTAEQLKAFEQSTRSYRHPVSLANSGAIINWPQSHKDWVRPGIMLYGANPGGDCQHCELSAVMTLKSSLVAIHTVKPGDTVGYGGLWRSDKATRIGTIGIGYGDGYPRHAKNGTPVKIGEHIVPLTGRVSMDLITVDLGDIAVSIGDEITLWGQELSVNTIADWADTISYQLLTGISERVERIYTESTG